MKCCLRPTQSAVAGFLSSYDQRHIRLENRIRSRDSQPEGIHRDRGTAHKIKTPDQPSCEHIKASLEDYSEHCIYDCQVHFAKLLTGSPFLAWRPVRPVSTDEGGALYSWQQTFKRYVLDTIEESG